MKRAPAILFALVAVAAFGAKPAPPAKPATPAKPVPPPAPPPPPQKPYAITAIWKIGGEGAFDAITVDPEGKTLFVPRMHRVQVIDAASGRVIAEIGPAVAGAGGGMGMCSVALAPGSNRGFITQSKDNSVLVFDLKTYAILGKIPVGDDPTSLLYDEASKKILLLSPGTKSIVCFSPDIDVKNPKLDPPIDLGEKPDSFVADEKGMVYVTIPEKFHIAVVDTRVMKVATTWPLSGWYRPFGISMDRLRSRLFIGAKTRIVVVSATDGHIFEGGEIQLGAGVDTTAFHDGKAFATTADGILHILGQDHDDHFKEQQTIDTALASRGVAVNPKTGVLYLPAAEMDRKKVVPGTFRILTLDKK